MIPRKYGISSGALTLLAWAMTGTSSCTYDYGQFNVTNGAVGGDFALGGNSSNQVSQGGSNSTTGAEGPSTGGESIIGGASSLQVEQGGTAGTEPIGTLTATGGSMSVGTGQGGQSQVAGSGGSSTGSQVGTGGTERIGTLIPTGGSMSVGTGQGGQSQVAGSGGSSTGGQGGAVGFDAEDGLVAHFAFDESTGTVAANLQDATKNGTYVGTCTHPTGQLGNAVGIRNLNSNSTGTSDWIELPAGLLSNLSATTLSVWVRDLSSSRTGARLFDFSLGTADEVYFAPDDTNGTKSLAGGHLGGTHSGVSFVDLWTTTPVLTDKNWHQVVCTWSAASIDLYIDGIPAGSKTSPGVLPSDLGVTTPNWLGRTLDDKFIALYSEIDDLRVYDKVLLASEIAQLFRQR